MNQESWRLLHRSQFDQICRLCSILTCNLISVSSKSIIPMILECTPLQVLPGDDLPQSICEECFSLLEKFVSFRKTCVETEINLLQVCNDPTRLVQPKDEFHPITETDIYPNDNEILIEQNEIAVKDEDNTLKNEVVDDDSDPNYLSAGSDASDFSDSDSEPLAKLKTEKKEKKETSTDAPKNTAKRKKYVRKTGSYKCEKCDKVFKDYPGIGSHMRNRHKQKAFKCTICPKKFYYEPQFKLHEKNHLVLKCEYCDKTFLHQKTFDEHLLTHGLAKPYGCLQCDGFFKNKRNLTIHIKMKHQRPPKVKRNPKDTVECPECHRMMKRSSLREHLKTHKERNKFTCPVCSKSFLHKFTLDDHRKRVHENVLVPKKELCNICGIKTSKMSLKHHLLSHVNIKPYACDQCDKKYKYADALKTHVENRHLNIRPHICSHCGLGFFTRRILENHIRTHTDERPFVCEICQQTFRISAGLYLHQKSHHFAEPKTSPRIGFNPKF